MSPDEQEAKSRVHGPDTILLVPLRSGNVGVFNREGMCAILGPRASVEEIRGAWFPCRRERQPRPTLEELGLF